MESLSAGQQASSIKAVKTVQKDYLRLIRRQNAYLRLYLFIFGTLWIGVLIGVLYVSRYITVPILAAVIFGIILAPVSEWMTRFKAPESLTVFVLLAGSLVGVGSLAYFLMPSLADLIDSVPKITEKLQKSLASFERLFSSFEKTISQPSDPNVVPTQDKVSKVQLAGHVVGYLTPAVSQVIIFIFTLLLFSSTRVQVRNFLTLLFHEREQRLSALRSFRQTERQLAKYFFTVTAINAGLGLLVALVMFVLGIPSFAVWGVLAFLLNYLPVVGPILIKATLLLFGLATYPNLAQGLAPVTIFTIISLIEANFVTPRIVGSTITMNPLVIFLAVVFWTWLWGAPGAFLAMPIVAIFSVVKDEFFKSDDPNLPS